jgi:hypothetical protein
MLKSEVLDFRTNAIHKISYFEDDSIDIVRHNIAVAMNTHPDRLFILVSLKFKHDYYQKDPRRWEDLFDRLAYNGKSLESEPFTEYQTEYRSPQTNIQFSSYDRSEWMMKPDSLAEFHSPTRDFTELRIFGVEDKKSYILPLEFNPALVSKIPAANLPQPVITNLLCTMYDPSAIVKFVAIPYDSNAENAELVYFPYLRSKTPNVLSDEIISIIENNKKLLKDLLEYEVDKEVSVNIQRAKFYAELVETDFGDAVRTKFEQIFYGITLSEEVPYIGFWTARNEDMRHKFYVKDSKKGKKPFLDMNIWKSWDTRRPSRNISTLVLFRGTGKDVYDRIAITQNDITMTFYRNSSNRDKIESMKKDGLKWLSQFDALSTFLNKNDIDTERFRVDEVEVHLNYSIALPERPDPRRLGCVSFLFTQTDKEEAKFNFLRTDRTNYGISPVEIKVLQLMRDGDVKPTNLAQELGVSVEKAKMIIQDVQSKLDNDPNLENRAFRNYPYIEFLEKSVVVSFVTDIDRVIKYANLLRYIIGTTDSKFDKICPKRLETVKTNIGSAPVQTLEVDESTRSHFEELFGFLEEEETVQEKEEQPKDTSKSSKLKIPLKRKSKYGYFKERLDNFDPETFNPPVKGFKYTKECEYDKQPIILDDRDLKILEGDQYDPRTYLNEKEMMNTYNPDGLIICPDYWCMEDQIPLTEEQLEEEDGNLVCPQCGRKVRTSDSDDPREYSVIKRDSSLRYPGYIDYQSLKDGRDMPCCFKTPRKEKQLETQDKYYVNRETIANLKELRVAFLSKTLINSLGIDETYELLSGAPKRLQTGMSAFFRVGIGRPSETLPELLGLKIKIPPPLESVETVLKCSFLRTWKAMNDDHLEQIENKLDKISGFESKEIVKTNLSKIISGINSAFSKKELSIMEELEYVCLFLQCDIFRIYTNDNKLGCVFYSPIARPRSRGIIVLQNKQTIDILCHVTRLVRGFEYNANIFNPPFKKETYTILEKLRNKSCTIKVPSYNTALNVANDVLTMSEEQNFEVILDPFGRAQAFFIPKNMFIPFQPVVIPEMSQRKVIGYSSIDAELYPKYDKVREYIEVAKKYNSGYEFEEDLYNSKNQKVEILLKSGLRIPVYPENFQDKEVSEVIETTNSVGEENVVFGEELKELKDNYSNISYATEVYEFLLYELTYDLKEDYPKLKKALSEEYPTQKSVEPLLKKWFEEKVEMTKATIPVEFISKIRKPCGQFKSKNTCNGNLCGWNGKTCHVEVKQSVRKDNLFYRMLKTLIENSKIRDMILEGRTTPFFGTILYLELPNELILTDSDIVNFFA